MAVEFITRKELNELSARVDSIERSMKEMEERLLAAFERHTRALLEEFIYRLEVIGEGFRIHEERITKLESKTGIKST